MVRENLVRCRSRGRPRRGNCRGGRLRWRSCRCTLMRDRNTIRVMSFILFLRLLVISFPKLQTCVLPSSLDGRSHRRRNIYKRGACGGSDFMSRVAERFAATIRHKESRERDRDDEHKENAKELSSCVRVHALPSAGRKVKTASA